MEISELRLEFTERLRSFAWNQWAQMGLLFSPERDDHWAADPEALLLLTFAVGRDDPRLFEEVLDWLLVNERLISVQRLRNLAIDEEDQILVAAVLDWVAQWRRKNRAAVEELPEPNVGGAPLFLGSRAPPSRPDPAFLKYGLLKGWTEPARRSGHPDLATPINFAFRMRSLIGIGARAEIVRVLLCIDAPRLSLQAIAASTGYAKRNVQEAAGALRAAGVATSTTLGNEQRFELPHERWLRFLDLERAPGHRDWPQLFHALRVLLRWLRDPAHKQLSEYMQASEARSALEGVIADLQFAGVSVSASGPDGAGYWPYFASLLRELPPT